MANPNIPAAVAAHMRAQGSPTAISLLELQLSNGSRFYIADAMALVVPLLAQFDGISSGGSNSSGSGNNGSNGNAGGSAPVIDPPPRGFGSGSSGSGSSGSGSTPAPAITLATFQPWMIEPPQFTFTNTLVTQTANCNYQNTSGNTVTRDNSAIFSKADLWGALFLYRLWLPAAEYALITTQGIVSDAEVDETQVELSLKSWLNFSEIPAPDCNIGPNCQNQFGSQQCGSASQVPCQNTYGSCSQLNRFKGVVTQWSSAVVSVGAQQAVAQPVPPVALNQRRPA